MILSKSLSFSRMSSLFLERRGETSVAMACIFSSVIDSERTKKTLVTRFRSAPLFSKGSTVLAKVAGAVFSAMALTSLWFSSIPALKAGI